MIRYKNYIKQMDMNGEILDLSNMSPEITKLLNLYYEEKMNQYTDYIDDISDKYGEKITWWATYLASRNVMGSDALRKICIVCLAIDILRENEKIQVVKVNNKAIADVLQKYYLLSERKIQILVEEKKKVKGIIFTKIISFGGVWLNEIKNRQVIKSIFKNKDKIYEKKMILIETDVFSSCFSSGEYCARDFANILEYTSENILFLPYLFINDNMSFRELVINMRQSKKYCFLFRENYLKLIDYIKVWKYPYDCWKLSKEYYGWQGIDVSPIIKEDLIRTMDSRNSMYAILNYYLCKRLKEKKIKIEHMIGWYEGQPSSMGLFKGFNEFYENKKSLGYIGLPFDEKFMSMSPSKAQEKFKVIPNEISVIGDDFKNLPNRFGSMVKTIMAPTFRLKKSEQILKSDQSFSILVALPYSEKNAQYVLNMLTRLVNGGKVKIYVKNHPTKMKWDVKDYGVEDWGSNYEFLYGSFEEALKNVDLVITASSSTAYETIMAGKKIIIIGLPSEILMTYIPNGVPGYHVVYTEEEIDKIIYGYKAEICEIRVESRNDYIMWPTKKSMQELLGK